MARPGLLGSRVATAASADQAEQLAPHFARQVLGAAANAPAPASLRTTLDILVADESLRAAQLALARSRSDALVAQAELLRRLVEEGAQVLVCGGLDMAREVRATLDTVLAPLATSTAELKAQGRYLEDAY